MSLIIRRSLTTLVPPKVSRTLRVCLHLKLIEFNRSQILRYACPCHSTPASPNILRGFRCSPLASILRSRAERKTNFHQGLSAAKDAVRMARIAKFYERLPKGPMPEIKPRGLLERYQHRYFGKNPSAARLYSIDPYIPISTVPGR
jgi:Mitochondrial F1-F0 ATP synthase subunit F of fungi